MNNTGRKTGLPSQLKSGAQQATGHDMSDVRIHRNSSQPAQLQAQAYAQGNDIHIASGQEKHLPHEMTHVVQQRQGAVQPTTHINGAGTNASPGLQQEADTMGKRASHGAINKQF